MRDGTLGMSTGASEPQVQAKAHQYIEQSADRHLVRLVSQLLAHGQLSSTWARMFGRERRRDRGRGQGGREARERGGGERWGREVEGEEKERGECRPEETYY